MSEATFRGGVHPYEGKELSKDLPIKTVMPKGDMVFPMSQDVYKRQEQTSVIHTPIHNVWRGTRGTETSKYPEEEKETSIS